MLKRFHLNFTLAKRELLLGVAASAALLISGQFPTAALAQSLPNKQFTKSDNANRRIAQRLSIPAFFALPDSARGSVPSRITTSDILVDFRHPESNGGRLGLRVIETSRAGMSERLGRSGLFQTGDLILSFWPEWGGAGAYPNVQMGVSHVGMAYIKDGKLHNIDNPLNAEYNIPSDLRSPNYLQVPQMHVVRPRGLTDVQRANLMGWIERFNGNAKDIYPNKLAFNQDYNAPKYRRLGRNYFVRSVAQIALGQYSGPPLDLYCSEFAWALLALRNCNPVTSARSFGRNIGIPWCVREPMTPMAATGDFMSNKSTRSYAGLADGPLMVIDAMGVQGAERQRLVDSVFKVTRPDGLAKMSVGHRETAKLMQPKFEALAVYYNNVNGNREQQKQASQVTSAFAREIPHNYSPTSFLINTLLPSNNRNRTMDYIATILVK